MLFRGFSVSFVAPPLPCDTGHSAGREDEDGALALEEADV
jgi:hypothetical protein